MNAQRIAVPCCLAVLAVLIVVSAGVARAGERDEPDAPDVTPRGFAPRPPSDEVAAPDSELDRARRPFLVAPEPSLADRRAGNGCFAASDRVQCEPAAPELDPPARPAVARAAPPCEEARCAPTRGLAAARREPVPHRDPALAVRDYSWRWCPRP